MTRQHLYACLALILTVTLATSSAPVPTSAQDLDLDPDFAADPVPDIWAQADSDEARSESGLSWMWGPFIRSATHEPYANSPDGFRQVYYFDKARMEINNPGESWESIWYATSGLLIKEMMLGEIQVGHHDAIETAPAAIPVTGDLEDNPDSPTYATLGTLTTLDDQTHNRASDRSGEPVDDRLDTDGSVSTLSNPPVETEVAYYDDTLGFNVPDVFWNWMNDQQIGWRYVIGHPVTEAYWVDTVIGGEEAVVLVQAFERRVLTFNPENESQWQVEAGNAGLHYRSWRNLTMPDDPSLHALAYALPYGEIIVQAANENGVDPYLLAGVVNAASDFDPMAELSDDRVGMMGVPLKVMEQHGVEHPFDPGYNLRIGADLLALLHNQNGSWEAAIEEYFTWQDAIGTFSIPPSHVTEHAIASWQEFESDYAGQPSPFIEESDDVEGSDDDDEVQQPIAPAQPPQEPGEDGLYFVGEGEAAHYGKEAFPVERMEHIMNLHASWGGAIDGWEYDPNGYYCVHPNYLVGERLHLTAPNGDTFWCTIADYVATEHRDQWWERWAIEVNWDLFEAMGVPYQQTIEVRAPAQ